MPRVYNKKQVVPATDPAEKPTDASVDAINVPVLKTNHIDATDQQVGQDNPRLLKSSGEAREALAPSVIEPVERPLDPEKMAMMAFMNEDIKIHIHSTTNKQDDQIFELFINGQREVFRRNESKTVKRKFVDLLARLKPTTFSQQDVTNPDGVKDILNIPHTGLRYPFSVVEDAHPRGKDWLRAVLAEG